jgi:hypothetical protein
MEISMKRSIIAILSILLVILVATPIFAKDISMKTNEVYKAEFTATNGEGAILTNCKPHFDGELNYQLWVTISPSLFNLGFNDEEKISITFNRPDAGYYTGNFNIACQKNFNGEDLGIVDLLNPNTAPNYQLTVSNAGVDQDYVITPSQEFYFLSKPGLTEKANFRISNTGALDLPIKFTIPQEYQDVIEITPPRFNLQAANSQLFTIYVQTPQDFEVLETNIEINIGDFKDNFLIHGDLESVASPGVALQSIASSGVEVGGLDIPLPIIIVILVGALVFMIRSNNNDSKTRDRKKK